MMANGRALCEDAAARGPGSMRRGRPVAGGLRLCRGRGHSERKPIKKGDARLPGPAAVQPGPGPRRPGPGGYVTAAALKKARFQAENALKWRPRMQVHV